jgi:putative transcriptional regulator
MRMRIDGKRLPKGKTNWNRIDSLSDEDIARCAQGDPAARSLTKRELARMKPVPLVKQVRRSLGFTQEQFAQAFDLSLSTIRDWEQGRSKPDQSSRTLLFLIEAIPQQVNAALKERRRKTVPA